MKKIFSFLLALLVSTSAFADFPLTGVLDDFNRANEGPPPSSSWTSFHAFDAGKVSSNAWIANTVSNPSWNYWNINTFGPNSEVYVKVSAKPTDGQLIQISLRVQGTLATENSYCLRVQPVAGASNDTVTLRRTDSGSTTTLATYTQEITNGDSIGLSAIGNTITAYYKSGAGAWTTLGSQTDSTYPGAGYIAISSNLDAAVIMDDFGGGTLSSGGMFQLF